jgi:thioredoxin reductase
MKNSDVIIVGGGPAGLNAAVVLARCKRSVLVFDEGKPRNQHSRGIHNYITRDGILPMDFLRLAQKEAKKYGVTLLKSEIIEAQKSKDGFVVKDKNANQYAAKKLLIATGVKDILPAIPGIEHFYGRSVFHCPYCDAWEVRNKMLGIYAKNRNGFPLAVSLLTWSSKLTLFTDGRNYLKPLEVEVLKRKKIGIVTTKIRSIEGSNRKIRHLVLKDGKKIPCDGLFFVNGYTQQSNLVEQLGCHPNKKSVIDTNHFEQTNIHGLYVAGDSSKDMHFVVVAAAEGARAAVNINKELQKEELMKRK